MIRSQASFDIPYINVLILLLLINNLHTYMFDFFFTSMFFEISFIRYILYSSHFSMSSKNTCFFVVVFFEFLKKILLIKIKYSDPP